MKHSLLVLALLLVPTTTQAMSLRDSATLRAVKRLERYDYFGQRNQIIRLGNNVRTRRMSPRRIVPQHIGEVLSVVDGSVVVVKLQNGETESVRTLGAEAPLLDTGSDKEQCYAREAQYALEHLLLGKTVALERDRSYQRDRSGRLLRYVRLNSMDINGWMIFSGYSFADDRHQHQRWDDYQDRETDARKAERGMWSNRCDYNPNPTTTFDVLQ